MSYCVSYADGYIYIAKFLLIILQLTLHKIFFPKWNACTIMLDACFLSTLNGVLHGLNCRLQVTLFVRLGCINALF